MRHAKDEKFRKKLEKKMRQSKNKKAKKLEPYERPKRETSEDY